MGHGRRLLAQQWGCGEHEVPVGGTLDQSLG